MPAVDDDPQELLDKKRPDFIDIVTDVDSHSPLMHMVAECGLAAICHEPMAPDFETAKRMQENFRRIGVPLPIHEYLRWQTTMHAFKQVLDDGRIGDVFRGRLAITSSFPVFDNQPFQRDLKHFIPTNVASHILDAARKFLLGHLRIEVAIMFGIAGFPFSDGAKLAIQQAYDKIFEYDWRERVLDLDALQKSRNAIILHQGAVAQHA